MLLEFASLSLSLGYCATALKANSRGSGRFFPRRVALRRIPSHALALKKYRSSTVCSSTPDNEQTPTTLGNSEELRVQNSPLDVAIPCVGQRSEDDSEIASLVA
jgi:hypothetical protein